MSIQFVITASFIFVTSIAIVFVGIALTNRVRVLAEENAIVNTRQIINQVNSNLDYYLRNMMDISNHLVDVIKSNKDTPNTELAQQMNSIMATRKDIVTMAVFSSEGELIACEPFYKLKKDIDITKYDWFTATIDNPENLFFSSPHVQNIFQKQHSWVVSLSREITFKRDGKTEKGVLLVDMNFSAIDQMCQNVVLGKKGYIYILDSDGNIVYHPQQQLINAGLKYENTNDVLKHVFGCFFDKHNGEKRLITIETVNYAGWRIVGIAYMDEIVYNMNDIGVYVVWILIFGILFSVFISFFISSKISQPIKRLEKYMKMVEQGNFDVNIDFKGGAEVANLAKAFNLMVTKIRQLMDQIVHEQEAKRISELEALQAQINPHFLYNTLDSIVWMAEKGKMQEVITMVTSLARLFRISISKGRNIITVEEEIEHARNYLIIQKIRYKNKFNFIINVNDKVLKYKTLKLVLQPIVENSIYHGIKYMVDEGLIIINAEERNGMLLFEVIDNGLGIMPEVLKNILTFDNRAAKGSGVGLKNVHERIRLYYGEDYGIQIESEPEEGTTVRIWQPIDCYEEGMSDLNEKG
ncbi:MAG TPA: histidine kinase [Clostridiales bacterium]|nr:histidine kinase [Clostridiales bacterium]